MSGLYLDTVRCLRNMFWWWWVSFYSMFFKQWELHLETVEA